MNLPDRWRCFWSWPPGHPFEVIDYFDGVAGRWAAFSRCVRCDRTRGLAVGAPVHGAVFANNPLATGSSQQDRRGRPVYVAHIIGADTLRSASPNLRRAVSRAMSQRGQSPGFEEALHELEHELG